LSGIAEYYNAFIKGIKEWLTSKRFSIYLVCIVIASLIWLLIKFSREYKTQFPITVELINPPDGNWMMLNNEYNIMAEIYGFGFDLFSYKVFGMEDITIDISEFEVNSNTDPANIIIHETFIRKKVDQLVKGREQVLNIYPGNIKVDLSKAITKTIPVKSNITVYPSLGFKIKGVPQLKPDSLIFFGPASFLNNIDFINTATDTIRGIQVLTIEKIVLRLDSLEEYLVEEVDPVLLVDVDELTSGSIEVKVEPIIDKSEFKIKVLPSKVIVYYQVGLSDYQKVSEELISATIELPDTDDLPDKLKVELEIVPDFIEVKRIEPLFVEYLIIKK
jgi:hypothetical protein